uniref:DUF3456 domain-containing protein n=1 Tax=Ascaris lumbricoides TaxID=6252 RepID=A0A0M3IS56_ASCLU
MRGWRIADMRGTPCSKLKLSGQRYLEDFYHGREFRDSDHEIVLEVNECPREVSDISDSDAQQEKGLQNGKTCCN